MRSLIAADAQLLAHLLAALVLARSLEFSIARHQAMLATPLLLECQPTAVSADAAECTLSSRIGAYLQRLRTRTFFGNGTPDTTAQSLTRFRAIRPSGKGC